MSRYRHPISTPVPELQGIATIAASPSKPATPTNAGEDDLVELIETRLLGVPLEEQDLALEDDDWRKIISALENKAGGLWYRRWHKAQAEILSLRAQLEEARGVLGKTRDLLDTIEQDAGNVWWVNADDPETAVCDTFSEVDGLIARLDGHKASALKEEPGK